MEKSMGLGKSMDAYARKRSTAIGEALKTNHVWSRMLKNIITTTIVVSLCTIRPSNPPFGKGAYLAAMTTVFAHPGRRFGQLVETLLFALLGAFLGIAWSLLGVYVASSLEEANLSAMFAIRAVFLMAALFFHGIVRSHAPRLFTLVLLQIIVCITGLTSTTLRVTLSFATQLIYPILLAVGVIFVANLCIFPEFSSSFLGETTIKTLQNTSSVLADAGDYFISHQEYANVLENTSAGSNASQQRKGIKLHKVKPNEWSKPYPLQSTDHGRKETNKSHLRQVSLKSLTAAKANLRSSLAKQEAAQDETQFELAFSTLPPRDLKIITKRAMKRLIANTIAVIGACESRYALLGETDTGTKLQTGDAGDNLSSSEKSVHPKNGTRSSANDITGSSREGTDADAQGATNTINLNLVRPKKEIEFGDIHVLGALLKKITKPYQDLHKACDLTVNAVVSGLSLCYVPKQPSKAQEPRESTLAELDLEIGSMEQALQRFNEMCTEILKVGAPLADLDNDSVDVMPRGEVFLVSSFLLNVQQAATQMYYMLQETRRLVEKHNDRRGQRRLYAPRIRWRRWLSTGDEDDEALPAAGRKAARQGRSDSSIDDDPIHQADEGRVPLLKKTQELFDEEKGTRAQRIQKTDSNNHRGHGVSVETPRKHGPTPNLQTFAQAVSKTGVRPDRNPATYTARLSSTARSTKKKARLLVDDLLDWAHDSEDVAYALKLTIAAFLVLWPAFVPKLYEWYYYSRGAWAGIQVAQVFEVSIGTSIMTYFLRSIGTVLGCLWGWAAFEAKPSSPAVCVFFIILGLIPSTYVQLGSNYPKAGQVTIISMCVVALSTELQTVQGTATENFLKRLISFQVGGCVAILVEMVVLPVKASTRLIESLTTSTSFISEMEACIAYGVEDGKNVVEFPRTVAARLEDASGRAKVALTAAETFLPFCSVEPRLKGSFGGLAIIYTEVLFVLRQIVDRMDNMLQLRTVYGSGPLEHFNVQLHSYRRNLAASITLIVFSVQEALTTRLPLPQFLPSARLAHLRLINKVRQVLRERAHDLIEPEEKHEARAKFSAWNASAAAQAEIIEYLEELTELTKLLVGCNEFRSGLLTRPTYHEYVQKIVVGTQQQQHDGASSARNGSGTTELTGEGMRRRSLWSVKSREEKQNQAVEEEIPASLQRIRSRLNPPSEQTRGNASLSL